MIKELQSSETFLHFGGRDYQELQSGKLEEKIKSLDIEENIKSLEHNQKERKHIVNVS